MSKKTRQQTILDIISEKPIRNQAELAKELKKKNFNVTQATLSRDITELNLVKSKKGYTRPQDATGSTSPVPDPLGIIRSSVVKIETAGAMVVLKTTAGGAQYVSMALENGSFNEIIGTIAGDDTVFVATKSNSDAINMKQNIKGIIN
jgi:transcriptional regulator of arginine metabolism